MESPVLPKHKAFHIDAVNKKIVEIEVEGLKDLQKAVGGLIEVGYIFDNRDTLYVDEEGMLKDLQYGFAIIIDGETASFVGNGILVGSTIHGDTDDVKMSEDDLITDVEFFGISESNEEEILH